MALTLRATKGSALTHNEMDANLTGLGNGTNWAASVSANSNLTLTGNMQSAKVRVGTAAALLEADEVVSATTSGSKTTATFDGSSGAAKFTVITWNRSTSGDNAMIGFYTEGAGSQQLRGYIDYNRAGNAIRYSTTSDAELKRDLGIAREPLYIQNLQIHDFEWIENQCLGRGVFAQEARQVYPNAISVGTAELGEGGRKLRPWGADYSAYVPDLIVGWQSHAREIASMKASIARLLPA